MVPDVPTPAVRRAPPRPVVRPLMSELLQPRPSATTVVDSTTQTSDHLATGSPPSPAARADRNAGAPQPPDNRDSDEEQSPRRCATDEEQSPRRTLRFTDARRAPRYHRRAIDDPQPASHRELSPPSLGFRELGSGASMASDILSKGVGRGGVSPGLFSTPYAY